MNSEKSDGRFDLIREIRLRVEKDGLYRADKDGRFRKIVSHRQAATVTYFDDQLVIRVSKDPATDSGGRHRLVWPGPLMLSECLTLLKSKLLDRRDVIDLDHRHHTHLLSAAGGFKLRIRGLGTVFAIKPHALSGWIPGAMPLVRFIAELDDRGWLLRGADGGTTRQVLIPGYGRYRFYCLKVAAGFGDDATGHDAPRHERTEPGEYNRGRALKPGPSRSERREDGPRIGDWYQHGNRRPTFPAGAKSSRSHRR